MKTLFFFRHGKSDWSAGAEDDHSRPLSPRGVRAARVMGRFLARTGQVPESIVSSSALRTRETLDLAVDAGGWRSRVRITDALYLADTAAVLEVIRGESYSTRSLMVIGHEPACAEMVSRLAGYGLPGRMPPVRFPTAAMARLDLDIEMWRECDGGAGQLVWLVPPKLFTKGDFED